MKHLRVITWCRWKIGDPFDDRFYSIFTASVLKPSWEYPIASVAMSIVKGNHKLFMRIATLESLYSVFVIPEVYRERLSVAWGEAVTDACNIRDKQRLLHNIGNLEPGSAVVRTDTGEIIAEAERIMRDGNAT